MYLCNIFKGKQEEISLKGAILTITITELEELVKQLESGKFKVDSDFALSTLSRIFDQNRVGRTK